MHGSAMGTALATRSHRASGLVQSRLCDVSRMVQLNHSPVIDRRPRLRLRDPPGSADMAPNHKHAAITRLQP